MPLHQCIRSLLVVPLLALLFGLAAGCSDDGSDSETALTIGALLPLTGSLSSYGETSDAALKIAADTINGGLGQVSLLTEDTKTDPATALEKLQSLHARGARLVIGPYASSEVAAVKEYADKNGIVLISPLSTARSLAVPDDNVFRFTPDDDKEGAAVAALAWADGVRVIVPVSRNDEGNLGLQNAMRASFEKLGGKVLPGITYPASETDFTEEMATLTQSVASAKASAGATVAVYLTAFSEVTKLFGAAAASADLKTVKWYGSDSVALSKELVADKTAAAFAVAAGYPNPILGLSDGDKARWAPVQEQLTNQLGRQPDAFALAAYDALVVGYDALAKAGADSDVATLKKEFTSMANGLAGLTGSLKLNAAGDRDIAIYDFWAVCQRGTTYTWIRAASYVALGTGQISRPEQC